MSATATKTINPSQPVKSRPARKTPTKLSVKKAAPKVVTLSTSSQTSSKSVTRDVTAEAAEVISQSIEATPDIAQTIGDLKQLDDLKKVLLAKEDALKTKVMGSVR